MIVNPDYLLAPRWPRPPGVQCWQTTRLGGLSLQGFATNNLGQHVMDEAALVTKNRHALARRLSRPLADLQWLQQVHGTQVVLATAESAAVQQGDAVILRDASRVGVVMTADCLSVVLANRLGGEVAVVHGGWRSLAAGILEKTVLQMQAPHHQLQAWLGPSISWANFVVGVEVRAAFCQLQPALCSYFLPINDFSVNQSERFQAGLPAIARQLLLALGVTQCHQGFASLWSADDWFSYRRQPVTGRMATLVWLDE
jgi:hypothetical protein